MVGQRLVSRNHHRTANSDSHPSVATETSDIESSTTKEISPVKNPFKRKRRVCLSSTTAKFFFCVVFLSTLVFLSNTSLFGMQIKTLDSSSSNNNNTVPSQLDLRPEYLTDDGAEDESESEDEEEEEATEAEEEEEEADNEEVREQPKNDKIPRTLIFTHYKNLLELIPNNALIDNHAIANIDSYTPQQLEELTLAINVRHSIEIHQQSSEEELKVLFWTDEDCIASLKRTKPALVPYFIAEQEGMYKADICRGTALLENGGFYLDVDVGVRHDLWKDLKGITEFVTAKVHLASNWVNKGFFQAILGSAPQNPILERYLELFEQHYNGSRKIEKGPLGVLLLYQAWNETNTKNDGVPTELYQEIIYQKNGILDQGENKGVLSPAPTWGKRRACHFLVAGVPNNLENVELRLTSKDNLSELHLQVPILSRIPGSRMCLDEQESDKPYNSTRIIESIKWWERA